MAFPCLLDVSFDGDSRVAPLVALSVGWFSLTAKFSGGRRVQLQKSGTARRWGSSSRAVTGGRQPVRWNAMLADSVDASNMPGLHNLRRQRQAG